MNDAWDPIEDLEPLDHDSLDLLASYRDASRPSEDAEARMLAGLRARLGREQSADTPAPAVSGETGARPREAASSNARTFAIAAVAFAAGVALTVSLARPSTSTDPRSASDGDGHHDADRHADPVARRATTGRPNPADLEALAPASARAVSSDESVAERPWPLSFADLSKPPEVQPAPQGVEEIDAADGPVPHVAEPTDSDRPDSAPSRGRHPSTDGGLGGSRDGATASRGPLRGAADPAASGRGTAIRGAWAPSVSGAPATTGIGSAARTPAVAGSSPTAPGSGSNSSPPGAESQSDNQSDERPPADEPPPSDEPEPESDPEPEDEQPLDELCAEEFDACLADAETFCESGYPGCESVHEFCFMRSMMCLDEDSAPPPPEFPEEPDPDDCEMDFSICMMEADAVCMLEKMVPEECDQMIWQCEESIAMCYGYPPPEPWW